MKSLYWIGIKESDLDDVKDIFNKSISFFGDTTTKNTSYSFESGKRVNHNLENSDINSFMAESIYEIMKRNLYPPFEMGAEAKP